MDKIVKPQNKFLHISKVNTVQIMNNDLSDKEVKNKSVPRSLP